VVTQNGHRPEGRAKTINRGGRQAGYSNGMLAVRAAWVLIVLYFFVLIYVLVKAPIGLAQQASGTAPADLPQVVKEQFGDCFEIPEQRTTTTMKYLNPQASARWVTFVAGDFDGDGTEDAVIVARCKDPLGSEVEYQYRVIDPYYTKHGFGDPRVTAEFGMNNPERQNLVLVIHGAGKDAWRAASPKSKFVLLNLPFETISLTRFVQKKRTVAALKLVEAESLSSVVYWDGKKYKWAEKAPR
jgi:hypothetical protein